MIKINIEALFVKMDEWAENQRDYELCRKKEDYVRLSYLGEQDNRINDCIRTIFDVFGLNEDDGAAQRAWVCWRAVHKWYERTGWMRCASEEMIRHCAEYIFQEKPSNHHDSDGYLRYDTVVAKFTNEWGMR